MIVQKLLNSRVAKNASWLIAGRIIQMILSFFVGLLTTRYLGPGNYGLINYAATYTTFFASLCSLGINSIIVKNFIDYPEEEGTTLCTAIILRAISSVASLIAIMGITFVADRGEVTTQLVVFLCGVGMLFQIFDTFNYWFQAKLLSKFSAIATLVAYILVSVYRIVLLIFKKDVAWFALASSIDYVVIACFLLIAYQKNNGPKFKFSWSKGKRLLIESCNFILSSLMVSIYGSTDRFMLKQMTGEESVGYYAIALTLCNMWVFVLTAIIDSISPTIMYAYNENKALYERRNKQLYAIVFYVSVFVSLCFMLFGRVAILVLYGEAYIGAATPLSIITWYTAFSYLGVARNAWIVCEHKQTFLKYLYLGAAISNVILNAILIPIWGASGAAMASLITQMSTILVFPALVRALRPNVKLMLDAILLKDVFCKRSGGK